MDYTKHLLTIPQQVDILEQRGLIIDDRGVAENTLDSNFNIPKYEYMRSWLRCITIIRNICAHHSRLWNTNIVVTPKLPERLPDDWITNRHITLNKLYPHLCCIAYWLSSINPSIAFTKTIKELLIKYPAVDPAAMGFPKGWENEPLWL